MVWCGVAWRGVVGGAKGWNWPHCPAWGREGSAYCPWHRMGSRPALNYSLTFYAVESPGAKDILLVTGSSLHHVSGKNNSSTMSQSSWGWLKQERYVGLVEVSLSGIAFNRALLKCNREPCLQTHELCSSAKIRSGRGTFGRHAF